MRIGTNALLILLAVCLFLVGVILLLADDTPDQETLQILLFGGLASFAAGHVFP